jgi:rubrerythrin
MFAISEIYDLAIQIEKNGEAFYRDALKKFSHPALNTLLQWLAEEEIEHQKWFIQKKEALKNPSESVDLENVSGKILENILGDQTFSLKEADLSEIDGMDALLGLAIEFEKDTIVFFEMIRVLIDDNETLEQLNEIIEQENHHVKTLQEHAKNWGEKDQNPSRN